MAMLDLKIAMFCRPLDCFPSLFVAHAVWRVACSSHKSLACASPRGEEGGGHWGASPPSPVAAGAPPDENSADGITCLRSSTFVSCLMLLVRNRP